MLSAVRQRKTDTVRPHYVRNLTNNADEHACKLEADVQTQKTQLSLAKGRGGEGKIGAWDYQVQTTMYKVDKQQGYRHSTGSYSLHLIIAYDGV